MQAKWDEEDELFARVEEPSPPGVAAGDGLPPGGWYELKFVRGCGPYLYFRYHDGNVRRTVYLGKATVEVADWVRAHQRRPRFRHLIGRSGGRWRPGPR